MTPEPSPPSEWYVAHASQILAAPGPVLDIACGRGRHALASARGGRPTLALDRNTEALRELESRSRSEALPLTPVRCDVETRDGLPVAEESCGAILVFRFLFRALAPTISAALRPGGLLVYETFTTAQKQLGYGPRNPDFLLEPGELVALFSGLELVAYEELMTADEKPEALARLVARKP